MSAICILVADNGRARTFTADKRSGPIKEQLTLLDPQASIQPKEITSDLPSSTYSHRITNKTAYSGHGVTVKGGIHQQTSPLFAKHIDHELNNYQKIFQFTNLLLIAPPHFLGVLRKQLNTSLTNCISFELNKELTHLDTEKIREHLPKILPTIAGVI